MAIQISPIWLTYSVLYATRHVEDDGLVFHEETVTATILRAEEEYEGVRINLTSMLGKARIPMQIDIGFGDIVTPAPQEAEIPAMLRMPGPRLRTYPRETVVAEKFEAIVNLGLGNTRFKDFYDLWFLAKHFDFESQALSEALRATFNQHGTDLPRESPVALTPVFYDDDQKRTQWSAFMRKAGLPESTELSLSGAVQVLVTFLMPLIEAFHNGIAFPALWDHQGTGWVFNHLQPVKLTPENDPTLAYLQARIANAPTDPEAIREAEADLLEFKRNMNLPRKEAGAGVHYPEVE